MKGKQDAQAHISMDDVSKPVLAEEEEEGWCTVRRTRSKFSPAGSARSVRHKAKNRFKFPSTAVSMPSLSLEDEAPAEVRETAAAVREGSITRPPIEKSASSASIVRHKEESRITKLGMYIE